MNYIISWQNILPKKWKIVPLKALASYNVSSVDKLTKEEETPVELCNYVDVYKNDFIMRVSLGDNKANRKENEFEIFISMYSGKGN